MLLANKAAKFVKITYETANTDSYLSNFLTYFGKESQPNEKLYLTVKDVLEEKAYDRIFDTEYKIVGENYDKENLEGTNNIKGTYEATGQYHFTLETQTCVCVPIEDGMDIYSSTQWIDAIQLTVASMLNLPRNSFNVIVRRLGGAYGAKITCQSQIACATALASYILNRPVRFVMTIESNMTSIGKRNAYHFDYNVDFDNNGRIKKLDNNYFIDMGSTLNDTPTPYLLDMLPNCYYTAAWKWEGKEVKTNIVSNTFMRGPGSSDGIAVTETIMEHIAFVTGKDPVDVRLQNIAQSNKMKQLLPDFLVDVGKHDFRFRHFRSNVLILIQKNIFSYWDH